MLLDSIGFNTPLTFTLIDSMPIIIIGILEAHLILIDLPCDLFPVPFS